MTTALIYSEKYLEHKPSEWHPERPERLRAIVDALRRANLWSLPSVQVIEPTPASRADIELVHDREYIALIERLSGLCKPLDSDTPVDANTFELALLAAGGAIKAGEVVAARDATNAFALVRPPGHHASRGHGGGFCYFNNLAIMIEHLRRRHGVKRVFVLDFDAHHGNGTQEIFYEDPSVLFMSIHQDGRTLYPGTGFVHEIGSGEGEGHTVNVPLRPGSADAEYASVMQELFLPLSEAFKPELIAVSAGMDAHADDPLTQLGLSTSAYGWLTRYVVKQAGKLCGGRVVLVLEGGYAVDAVAGAAVNIVRVLTGWSPPLPTEQKRPEVVDDIRRALADCWRL
ncbi:MAG: histone deacetylase [Candidatus Hodarchaeaceae archaeon]|nr:histone deacetylase [Candidatus Hodarchaeaceae archaeon]